MNESSNTDSQASRRRFLKSAAAVAGSLALPSVHAAGAGIIRVGVVGCGGRGEAAAMNAMNAGPDVHIVAMGDILLDRVQEKRASLKLKIPRPGGRARCELLRGLRRI